MKKIFIILVITLGCVVNLSGVKAATRGDINEDGRVSIQDLSLLQQYLTGLIADSDKALVEKNGDLNNDGTISAKDGTELHMIISGISSENTNQQDANNQVGNSQSSNKSNSNKNSDTRGDINGDGKIDRNDYALLLHFTSASVQGGSLSSEEKQMVKKNGDINGDGTINDKDTEELMVLIRIDEDSETYKNLNKETVSCGSGMISGVPSSIPRIVNVVYTVLQIAVPIIIVILGMIDLIKAVMAQKEDEVKKAQMTFIKRLIAGALVFFVFVIVKLLVSVVADNSTSANKIIDCADCFLNGVDNCKVSKGG